MVGESASPTNPDKFRAVKFNITCEDHPRDESTSAIFRMNAPDIPLIVI